MFGTVITLVGLCAIVYTFRKQIKAKLKALLAKFKGNSGNV